mgnify:FL=1
MIPQIVGKDALHEYVGNICGIVGFANFVLHLVEAMEIIIFLLDCGVGFLHTKNNFVGHCC